MIQAALFLLCAAGGVIGLGPLASAQTSRIPGGVEPGRIPGELGPPAAPAPTPEIVTPEIPETVSPEDAERIKFVLRRIVVDGATVYNEEQLKPLYADLLDHEISLADIYRIANVITVKYRSDGYILSRSVVPAQRISDGEVHLTVVEGFIDKVIIQGTDSAAVRAYADRLTMDRPLTAEKLERYLLLINDLPGVHARGVLSAATGVPGGSDMTLVVDAQRFDANLATENRGSKYIGPMHLFGEAALNSPFSLNERLGVRYVTDPFNEQELRYGEADFSMPIGAEGLKFSLNANRNTSQPGSSLNTPTLRTNATGESLTARLSYPLVRSRTETLRVDGSFTYRDASLDQFSEPSGDKLSTSYFDQVRALRLGLSYDIRDSLDGRNFMRAEVSRGLAILGAQAGARYVDVSRTGAQSDFWKLTLDASRVQPLDRILPGLGLLTAASAQGTPGQQLLASEQFGVGGALFGRGYDPSEITGDYGMAGKIELQYTRPMFVAGYRPLFQGYLFYDAGLVSDENAGLVNDRDVSRSLASTGIGLRMNLEDRLSANIEIAQPLTRPVASYQDNKDATPTRLYFSLALGF